MRIWGFVIGGFFLLLTLCSLNVANRVLSGSPGDYIVTEQDRNFSLLLLKELKENSLIFEEITVPSHLVSRSSTNWKQWLEKGAKGHTSWVQYEMDSKTLQLVEGYSFSKNAWLYLDEPDHFLSNLLSISLRQIPDHDRKKIGPPPGHDEPDRRKTWNPPVVVEGKKIKTPCEAWTAIWPQDSSLLASCQLTLYFPPVSVSPFPSWIEASNGHFSYAVKVIDSGKKLESPLKRTLPHRPPQLLKHVQIDAHQVELPIRATSYYTSFSLYTQDLLQPGVRIGPIPFHLKSGAEKSISILTISFHDLSSFLKPNHRYKWILVPDSPEAFTIESDDFFRWSPQFSK